MHPIRLVITAPWARRAGGAENMLHGVIRNLDRDLFDPHVVFLEAGPMEREMADWGISTRVISAGRLRNPHRAASAVVRLAQELRRDPPDLILSWAAKPHLYTAPAAATAGMRDRLVWWQHGIPHGYWMDRLATALPARAIGCSSSASAEAQARLRPHRPTFVVHPGISPIAAPSPNATQRLRARLGIPPERPVVGIVGRLQPLKGHLSFVRALNRLRDSDVDAHGLIVGGEVLGRSSGFEQTVRDEIEHLNLTDAVTMTGQVSDAHAYIALMDIFVTLSRGESFGIVLLEAMAMKKAVVALAIGGHREIVVQDKTGVLIDDDDPQVVADALLPLLTNRDRRLQLGHAGRGRLIEKFTDAHMTETMQANLTALAQPTR